MMIKWYKVKMVQSLWLLLGSMISKRLSSKKISPTGHQQETMIFFFSKILSKELRSFSTESRKKLVRNRVYCFSLHNGWNTAKVERVSNTEPLRSSILFIFLYIYMEIHLLYLVWFLYFSRQFCTDWTYLSRKFFPSKINSQIQIEFIKNSLIYS